jgi:asparagine synthetase B (glutamine-hydrolysing)
MSQSPVLDPSVARAPFLHLRLVEGQTTARGVTTCRLGQPLDFGRAIPDGAFAAWTWDGSTLTVRNDRYGLQPLFYWSHDAELGISPSLPRLLLEGAPAELDEPALAVFIRSGYFVGEDTPFRAIRALPPNASLTWTAGQLIIHGGYPSVEPRTTAGATAAGRDEAIDAYIPLLRAAVRRRLPLTHDLVMPLSGGRDSRHLLFEIVAAGTRPSVCLTVRHHPPRTDDDAVLAGQVAAELGLPHRLLDQTAPRLEAEYRKNVKTGYCSDEGTAFMALGDHLGGREVSHRGGRQVSVFDGIGGDFLSDGRFLTPRRQAFAEAGQMPELANALLWRGPLLPSLLSDDLKARLSRSVAVERLTAEVERHRDAASPVTSYIFWNRCRREIATFPFSFYPPNVSVLCPYLDHEVFDFLISLPASVFMPPSFHAEAIQRAFPAHAAIPFESASVATDADATADVQRLLAEIDAALDQRPPRLISAEKARTWLRSYVHRSSVTVPYLSQMMYALTLDRFLAEQVSGR